MGTLSMGEAIFLSASVPDPKRSPEYAATADTVAITAAVSALVYVTLGRRMLIWGGHPAITPMIWVVAHDVGVDYGSWVRLYQSRHFEDEFPEDNERFRNVIYTDDVGRDREKSLLEMRERMFAEHTFKAAVFIGGMGGIVQEFELFRRFQPQGLVVPVASTGGATLEVATKVGLHFGDLADDFDYVALFHRHLNISVRENRYRSPKEQPKAIEERFWRQE
jgi:SLOG cluster3 family